MLLWGWRVWTSAWDIKLNYLFRSELTTFQPYQSTDPIIMFELVNASLYLCHPITVCSDSATQLSKL